MQHVRSKDLFYLLRDTLKLFDRRPIVHGGRVAYIVAKMLSHKGGWEDFELADVVFLTTFHDIGAYRTDDIEQMVLNETRQFRAHSLYGQLLLNHLTLLGEMSKVVLNHHIDFATLTKSGYAESELVSYISMAEAVDIFSGSLGAKFSLDIFSKQLGTRYSPAAFQLFKDVNDGQNLFEQIRSRAYIAETEKMMDNFILKNDEKEKLLELLMFALGLKSGMVLCDAAMCVALCEKLGTMMKLGDIQRQNLIYAAYLHDIGYMAFPKEWIEAPLQLIAPHQEKLAHHTVLMEQLLKDRIRRDVIAIAATHHERADGNGYPRKLGEKQMNTAQMILQFADLTATMMRPPLDKEELVAKIKIQTEGGRFGQTVARFFLEKIDEIIEYAEPRSEEILKDWRRVESQYTQLNP